MNIKESIVLPMTMEEEYKNADVDADSLDLEIEDRAARV